MRAPGDAESAADMWSAAAGQQRAGKHRDGLGSAATLQSVEAVRSGSLSTARALRRTRGGYRERQVAVCWQLVAET